MRMQVKCGNEDCREEFYVESAEAAWECPICSREIENRYYPFLSAMLMQAKIDVGQTVWKAMFKKLIASARKQIDARNGNDEDLSFLYEAEHLLENDLDNNRWKEEHDALLERSRELILKIENG
ncbi:MAG: hypothetical protein U9R75_00130 [Candidatus Thermoplasmatota archaeon]|nr:hypothetical protein [Candidatus Thermoplasmatota archaeon]